MRFAPLVVFFLVASLAVPGGSGGSAQDPEIQDGTSDITFFAGISTTVGAPEIDLTRVWFETDETTVSVSWEVVDFGHRLQADEALDYAVTCRSGTASMGLTASWNPLTGWAPSGVDIYYPINGTGHSWHGSVTVSANVVRLDAPRFPFPAPSCTGPVAFSDIALHVGGGWSSQCCLFWWRDIAPDQGHGRDVVFT